MTLLSGSTGICARSRAPESLLERRINLLGKSPLLVVTDDQALFAGQWRDVALYDSALAAQEIQILFL